MEWIKNIYKQVLEGYNISKEEAYKLIDYDVEVLRNYAKSIREQLCGNVFDLCSIINGKSGACSENCKYCAQSAHYSTRVETYPLLDAEVFIKDAKEHKAEGVLRYSIVTSGKRLSKKEVEDVAKIYKRMREECEIKLCASHGLLDEEDFTKLKEAGIVRYHNNLETSRNYFASICTTHTYEDKIKTIKAAQRVGLEVCSGGLFGIGETMEDRIDMAFELREMGVTSIPINVLVPIPGTPMEKMLPITEEEVLKSIAIYRFIYPTAFIRLAGGRMYLTDNGRLAFEGGANATITGNLLTTCGNTIQDDLKMLKTLGFEVKLSE
ncbi:MAG: biotin synthase BioB [Zhenhengia sp.]|jgi:biotin synthase|uniref:biotin synthase BioB n=1 Tax=Zhenhengia sp. TaxID=2944208 RepID=UPI0029111D1D|nr:biotin synthase BioB [Clostridiales bacterium]MDU6975200.1 biotin synthase BioB [Clostridiales bacterium]